MIESRHTGLNVKSLADSLAFYVDTLGLAISKLYTEPEGEYIDTLTGIEGTIQHWAKVGTDDGYLLELVQWVQPSLKRGKPVRYNARGVNHICFQVDDVEAYMDRLLDAGYDCQPIQLDPPGNVKNFVTRGPDNEIVELVEVLEPMDDAAISLAAAQLLANTAPDTWTR